MVRTCGPRPSEQFLCEARVLREKPLPPGTAQVEQATKQPERLAENVEAAPRKEQTFDVCPPACQ